MLRQTSWRANALKRNALRVAFGLVIALTFVAHSALIMRIPLLDTLDAFVYDARLRLTAPGGVDERIVIVDVDEASLAELGRWPWSRDRMAALVTQLFDHYAIKLLGFDVVFAEPDSSSGLAALDAMTLHERKGDAAFRASVDARRSELDYDRRFADALRGRPVVLGNYFSNLAVAQASGVLPEPALSADALPEHLPGVTSGNGYGANLATLQQAAGAAGHFNPVVDFDGISRRVPMLVEYRGGYYPSLTLAMARVLLGRPALRPVYPDDPDYGALEWLELVRDNGAVVRIPVDEQAASLVPYRGAQGSFRYVSAADVLGARVPDEQLRNRIVLFGTTAPGLMDLRATPVGSTYAGVEIHANLLAGILDQTIVQKPAYLLGAEVLLLVVCALLLAVLLPIVSPLHATLAAGVVLLAVCALNLGLWSAGLAMPLASTFAAIVAIYAFNMAWGYFTETRSKRQFAELFGQYVPPELVDVMARDPRRYSMEGRNQELTVLFSDVRGFTSISEGLDPKELSQLMNAYLGAMTAIVRKNRGTLDKYIGDAIMAFWGAPVAAPDHARRAVLTALAMQSEVRRLDAPFAARGWPALRIGVGINTGTMTVGDMGSTVRKSYTVMGDAVNLGSRLEGITKQYGVGIIVSATTRAQVDDIVYRELDRVRVKGKDEPVAIYEPLGGRDEIDAAELEELAFWDAALQLYRSQQWEAAAGQLYNLSRRNPQRALYALYIKRVAHYREHPPGDAWDGVTTFETK